jgi:hypothetical protein
MKTYGRGGGTAPLFLTLALDKGEWSATRPCCFTPQGKSPGYPLDRWLGGPQSQSGRCGDEKNLALPGIKPGPSSLQSVAIPTKLSRLLVNIITN